MKGDFTRFTFKPTNHYSSVRSQQGRVQVDADWNEAVDILAHWDRTTRRDVIGPCGGPQGRDGDGNALAGFLVEVADASLHITRGRYYVNGLLVENDREVAITEQPDLPYPPDHTLQELLLPPLAPEAALPPGTYLAFLDVWERHITALEDVAIREVALGGPDTTTRTRVVWQVRLMQAETQEDEPLHCASELPLWNEVTAPSSGRLNARAEPGESETDPCIVPARGGYRGLENQLYRVEVHRVNTANNISIKWSRENGSTVFGWTGQDTLDPNKLTLSSTGRDDVLGLDTDDWVELTDDQHELRGEPGLLVRVVNVEGNVLTVDPGSETVTIGAFPVKPKVRRWDMPRDVGEMAVDLTLADNWIELESGVEVMLEPGTYRTGDFWVIPARTATRDIEWPQDDVGNPLTQPPHGIQHHYCRLALLSFDGENWTRLSDCRNLFPPLTEMIRFFHVAGDGQEAMPDQPVPRPLEVGVVNGQRPVAGARVQFRVVDGGGQLRAPGETPCSAFTSGGDAVVVVETDPDGVAGCCWRLDAATLSQQVEATLLEIDGKLFMDDTTTFLTPIRFNANLSVASQVAYTPDENCPDLSNAETVQQAIDLLCQRPQGGGCCVTVGRGGEFEQLDDAIRTLLERGQRDLCICLLAGEHTAANLSVAVQLEDQDLHLTIHGCGMASRLVLVEGPWRLIGVRSVVLRDLAIESAFQVNDLEGALSFRHCAEVSITGCHILGLTPEGPLVSILDADQVRLRDNLFEASRFDSLRLPQEVFEAAGIELLAELFSLTARGAVRRTEFRRAAAAAAQELAALDPQQRGTMRLDIQRAFNSEQRRPLLSNGELFNLGKFAFNLAQETVDPANLFDLLFDIRRAAIKSHPGLALILAETFSSQEFLEMPLGIVDEDDLFVLESNEIDGMISLYGPPVTPDLLDHLTTDNFLEFLRGQVQERRILFNGWLGTLQVRGNQLVQITVTSEVVRAILEAQNNDGTTQLLGLFKRCLITENVFEGGNNLMIDQHLAMTTNDFKLTAVPVGTTTDTARLPLNAGLVIADSSIYTANHGGGQGRNVILRDVSRISTQAANLDMTIG